MDELAEPAISLWLYWNALPKIDGVPLKSSFNPMAVPRLLPELSIVEQRGVVWFIRLAGMEVVSQIGMDPTGMNYLDLVWPEQREQLDRVLRTIVSRPCAYRGTRIVTHATGICFAIASFVLPLRNSKGEISLILAVSHRLRPADRDYAGGFSSLGISEFVFMDIGKGVPERAASDRVGE